MHITCKRGLEAVARPGMIEMEEILKWPMDRA